MSRIGIGSVIGSWRLIKCVGAGFSGEVYSCKNITTEVMGAIKVQRSEIIDDISRIEMRIQVFLSSGVPENQTMGIPRVFDLISIAGQNMIVMEHLGPSLNNLIGQSRTKRFSTKTVLMVGVRLIRLLKFIHSKGVFHGDVSEDNVVVGGEGFKNKLFLIDYGRSTLVDADGQKVDALGYIPKENEIFSNPEGRINETSVVAKLRERDLNESLALWMMLYNPRLAASVGAHSLPALGRSCWLSRDEISTLLAKFPKELELFMAYFVSRPPNSVPDYTHMQQIFLDGLSSRGLQDDGMFDWMM